MKKFLTKVISFAGITIAILIALGYFLEYRFSKDLSDKGTWLKTKVAQEYDYVFLGSSRTWNMVDINYIDSALVTKGLNLGAGGVDFRTLYMTLYSFAAIQENKIEKAFIQVDPFMLYRDSTYNKPKRDHSFYSFSDHEEISNCFQNKRQVWVYRTFPIIKYIEYNKVYNFTHFIRSFFKSNKIEKDKGSKIIYDHLPFHPTQQDTTIRYYDFEEEDLFYLIKILDFCKDRNIETYLYTSPIYSFTENYAPIYPNFEAGINDIARKYGIDYGNYIGEINAEDLYADMVHLNHKGTAILTRWLIEKIR